MKLKWTKAQMDFAIKNKDSMSRGDIAKKIGKSRNAVCGFLWRYEQKNPKPLKKPLEKPVVKPLKRPFEKIKPNLTAVKRKYVVSNDEPVSLLERSMARQCGWLIDDNNMCCGLPIFKGSYCREHYEIAYQMKPSLYRKKI